jgi:hypothetical protein
MIQEKDIVEIIEGRYTGCTGSVLYFANKNKDVILRLDQYSMMLKISVDWIIKKK